MINKAQLDQWRRAKVLAITNPNTDAEVLITLQEMFIEVKALRRDNLRLLNHQDLMEKMARYIELSKAHHYISPDLEELLEEIIEDADATNYTELNL